MLKQVELLKVLISSVSVMPVIQSKLHANMTSKGQMTIPVELRRELELNAGDRLNCFIEGERLVIVPAKGSLKKLKGIVAKPAVAKTIEEMNGAIEDEAAARMMEG